MRKPSFLVLYKYCKVSTDYERGLWRARFFLKYRLFIYYNTLRLLVSCWCTCSDLATARERKVHHQL